jgi:hypothetical protein
LSCESFESYLKSALELALEDERQGRDGGNLNRINKLCRTPVQENWEALTEERFLQTLLWCVGSVRKPWKTHQKYYPRQLELFYSCDSQAIVANENQIRTDWIREKRDLNERMVNAVMNVAKQIVNDGWMEFKQRKLLLPNDPETDDLNHWRPALKELKSLPQIRTALSSYLLRNLYGAAVFKPDVHIICIAEHFFGEYKDPIRAMTNAVKRLWPKVCNDERFLPVHIGEVDYILWWYRSRTGKPIC